MDNNNYKSYFLKSVVVALSISVLLAVYLFRLGEVGDTEIQLLVTSLTIDIYSITGLCSSTIHSRNGLKIFSRIGMLISVLGFLVTILSIWVFNYETDLRYIIIVFFIISLTISHISLLLQISPVTNNIKYLLIVTFIFISIVGSMLIKLTLTEFKGSDLFLRLLGVFIILVVLGTIVTLILNWIAQKKE